MKFVHDSATKSNIITKVIMIMSEVYSQVD